MKKQLISLIFIVSALLLLVAVSVTAQDSEQPFLGILLGESEDGALVTQVLRDTPAAEAGLEAGDIITTFDGEAVTAATLADMVHGFSVGDTVTLEVLRDGDPLALDATLATQPQRRQFEFAAPQFERAWLGVTLEQTDDGIVIGDIAAESPAAEAGLQAGDILTAINDESVETGDEVATIIGDMEPGDTVTLSIMRDGASQEIEATLGSVIDRGFNVMANSDIVIL